ncbi:MAG: histidine kinase [Crocinitomicaceae bacterium]|jgi:signal transduction histidine kinase|nr:histidine kinase [Crocinitomicaceae bacterium]
MKIVLVTLFLAFSFGAPAQKGNAFFMRLNQAEKLLESNPDKALEELAKLEHDSLSYSKEQKRKLYLCLAAYYKNVDLEPEKNYLLKSLSFGTPPKIRTEIYYKLAANASGREEYTEVIDYLTKIFSLKKYASSEILAKAQILMGANYCSIKDYSQSEKFLLPAIETASRLSDKTILMHAYINMGVLNHYVDKPANALYYYRKALKYAPVDDLYRQESIKANIGAELVDIGNYEQAEVYLREALKIATEIGDENGKRICFNNLAIIRRDRKQFREALDYFLLALQIDQRSGAKDNIRELYLNLAEVYEELGNTKTGLQYYKQYTELKDELFDEEKAETLLDIQEKYNASERDKQIAEMKITKQQDETDKLNMSYIMLTGGILVIFAAVVTLAFFRIKTLRARNKARLELISASLDAEERERLRISQELHDDLGGILGMSRMLFSNTKKILRPQAEELYDRIDQLLVMANTRSRAISHELFSPTLKTFGLVKALEEHLDNMRFANPEMKLTLETGPELELDPLLELNLFRISQELLNNSLKYAAASNIGINIEKRGGFLYFSYSDDGKGFDPVKIKKGVGLNSIDSRIQRFEGQSSVKTAPGKGFTLNIRVPLKD